MNIAIVTGASSGLGVEYIKNIVERYTLDEIWIIARRKDRLERIANEYDSANIVPIALDLSDYESYNVLKNKLNEKNAVVKLLVNNAGYGILGDLREADHISQSGMIDLNCRALTAITTIVLPFMKNGSYIVNVCSIASFCPNARMTVYSSTKAFVLSFSKGIRFENKKNGINVLAVCPGPMETEFLSVAGINGNSKTFETLPYCNPEKVAKESLIYAEKGRGVYTPRMLYKLYRVLAKLLPHSIMMHITKT